MKNVKIAVFDTNVLVSGLLSPSGSCGRIVELLNKGMLAAAYDSRISIEYQDVLKRPEFAFPHFEIDVLIQNIFAQGSLITVSPENYLTSLPDPDDSAFAECAIEIGCPLVTGNMKHFPKQKTKNAIILTPKEFMETILQ